MLLLQLRSEILVDLSEIIRRDRPVTHPKGLCMCNVCLYIEKKIFFTLSRHGFPRIETSNTCNLINTCRLRPRNLKRYPHPSSRLIFNTDPVVLHYMESSVIVTFDGYYPDGRHGDSWYGFWRLFIKERLGMYKIHSGDDIVWFCLFFFS